MAQIAHQGMPVIGGRGRYDMYRFVVERLAEVAERTWASSPAGCRCRLARCLADVLVGIDDVGDPVLGLAMYSEMCPLPRLPTPTIATCSRSPDFGPAFLPFFSAASASDAGNAAVTAAAEKRIFEEFSSCEFDSWDSAPE